MPDLLIRGVSEETLQKLKKMAADNKRSLQQELLLIIENIAAEERTVNVDYAILVREHIQAYGKEHTDSTKLIRSERDQ